jgi:hypothetical protein
MKTSNSRRREQEEEDGGGGWGYMILYTLRRASGFSSRLKAGAVGGCERLGEGLFFVCGEGKSWRQEGDEEKRRRRFFLRGLFAGCKVILILYVTG